MSSASPVPVETEWQQQSRDFDRIKDKYEKAKRAAVVQFMNKLHGMHHAHIRDRDRYAQRYQKRGGMSPARPSSARIIQWQKRDERALVRIADRSFDYMKTQNSSPYEESESESE